MNSRGREMTGNKGVLKGPGEAADLNNKRAVEAPSRNQKREMGGGSSGLAAKALDRKILDKAAELFIAQEYKATSMEQFAAPKRIGSIGGILQKSKVVIDETDEHTSVKRAQMDRLHRNARLLLSINLRLQLVALHRVTRTRDLAVLRTIDGVAKRGK